MAVTIPKRYFDDVHPVLTFSIIMINNIELLRRSRRDIASSSMDENDDTGLVGDSQRDLG